MRNEDIDAFQGALARTPELWRSINFRAVAIWSHGDWQNLASTAYLGLRPPGQIPAVKHLPCVEGLIVVQEVFPITELPRLIRRIQKRGQVQVAGKTIRFCAAAGYTTERFSAPYAHSYARCGHSLDDHVRGDFARGHSLAGYGDRGGELLDQFPGHLHGVDAALRREGWQSLNEVLLRALDDVSAVPQTTSSRVVFLAPIEAALDEVGCELREGVLRYVIRAGSREAGRRATLLVTGEDRQGRRLYRTVGLEGKPWKGGGGGFRHSGELRFPNARVLNLTLQVAGYEVGTSVLSDAAERPPILMVAHEMLYPRRRSFEDVLLRTDQSERDAFQRAIAKLMTYCGFITDYPGGAKGEEDGPDVMVEIRDRNLLLAMEVTTKRLMNEDGKMDRLYQRSAELRLAFRDAGTQIAPVMVGPWHRETLAPGEMLGAEANGVRVLCKEDLADLLAMARQRASTREIAHYIIPESTSPGKRRWSGLNEMNPLADL